MDDTNACLGMEFSSKPMYTLWLWEVARRTANLQYVTFGQLGLKAMVYCKALLNTFVIVQSFISACS